MAIERLNDEIEKVTLKLNASWKTRKKLVAMEAFKNSRVTIVDDDPLVCEALTEMIRFWGLRA